MCCLVTGGKGNCFGNSAGAATADVPESSCSALMVDAAMFEINGKGNQGLWMCVAKEGPLHAVMSLRRTFPKISRGRAAGRARANHLRAQLRIFLGCLAVSITLRSQETALETSASPCLRTSVLPLRAVAEPRDMYRRTARC